MTGPRFGYPGGAVKAADNWRGTFLAMLDAVLADAAAPAPDEVATPALVRFDLWEGDSLLHRGSVGAVIDGERMF
ncbi:hypothetical protein [Streptomyces sp. NPDC049879]|uniref:hypothetical protein n=1 Tax=Streptomyces sp. NPDC049879 TaxID=3365598 RepID=UPI003794A90A